jgi:hypothetical protein
MPAAHLSSSLVSGEAIAMACPPEFGLSVYTEWWGYSEEADFFKGSPFGRNRISTLPGLTCPVPFIGWQAWA